MVGKSVVAASIRVHNHWVSFTNKEPMFVACKCKIIDKDIEVET